jgi:predicted Fe-S protein YdhL (DUF1289 family)
MKLNKIISPCISECDNNGEFCPACGRTMEEKFEWKRGADETRKKQILEDCGSRLTQQDYEYWGEMYDLKVAEKMRENNDA